MDSTLVVPDPYDPQLFPGLDTLKLQKKEENGALILNLRNQWTSSSFKDMTLKPGYPPREEDTSSVSIPGTLANTDLADRALKMDVRFVEPRTYQMNSGNNLRGVWHTFNSWMTGCRNAQQALLLQELDKQGYTKPRTDPEIREEIERLQEEFPGNQVWCIADNGICSYYDGVSDACEEKYPDGAWLLRTHHNYGNGQGLRHFYTSIFTDRQVRASQEAEYSYRYNRVPRAWEVQILLVMKFSIEVAPHSASAKEVKKIIPGPVRMSDVSFRFKNLG